MGIKTTALQLASFLKAPFYSLYEKRLGNSVDLDSVPDHIGIILDGNRRYARQTGLESIIEGHAHGADKLDEVLGWCYDFKIPVVTVWIFSLDNFHRKDDEVEELLQLIEDRLTVAAFEAGPTLAAAPAGDAEESETREPMVPSGRWRDVEITMDPADYEALRRQERRLMDTFGGACGLE